MFCPRREIRSRETDDNQSHLVFATRCCADSPCDGRRAQYLKGGEWAMCRLRVHANSSHRQRRCIVRGRWYWVVSMTTALFELHPCSLHECHCLHCVYVRGTGYSVHLWRVGSSNALPEGVVVFCSARGVWRRLHGHPVVRTSALECACEYSRLSDGLGRFIPMKNC